MQVPSDDEIRALHAKHAPTPEAFDRVYTHCVIVADIAGRLLADSNSAADPALVRAGSLLHDIGVYRLYNAAGTLDHAHYIRHGVLGREVLTEEGLPEALCRFCSCHTGVGITREDVRTQDLPIPEADYLAESEEEQLVMFADKFHSKSEPSRLVSAPTAADRLRRFGEEKELLFKTLLDRYGEPDLRPFQERYGHVLV
ncbi:HD domain-containing protein [Streptomonospora litoralis]|uniref:tRNA 2'-O-methylase n=1 Tax=Streptomonospora litoralis TaxID=2498135 RepID=A0A4V0ZJ20_9ACTN|nr:HD domain-containing protein [Streptomonospora litoralis]QBI51952.1 tRNA 2'-O-methylase [Streptomonospora litoralis]